MRSISSILRTGGMLVLTVVPLCAIIDLDGDGISDVWTARYGVTTATDADPDGDGATNHAEAVAGTNPTDAEDHLAATLRTTADKKMLLSWPSVFGKRYRIETSVDLKTWTEFRSQLTGTVDSFSETLGEACMATSPNFWRVAVDDTDSDSDGISDWEEAQLRTTPTNPDTDGDGMVDSDEYRWFGGFSYDGTGDSDGDGENDASELSNGTSPYDPYNGTAPPPPPAGFTDAIPPKGRSTMLAPTSWCFFILPDDYELVAVSVSGVAVLKRTSSNDGLTVNAYYRWDLGSIDELGAHVSAVINRRGTIAMSTRIRVSPYQNIPAANVWPRKQTTPWVYIPPFVSASGYSWWYEEYWSTRWNHIDLIAIDDNNTIWYETLGGYDNTRGYYYNAAAAPYGGAQEIHPQFIRFGATDNGSHYFGLFVSASGTPYGWEIIGDYPSTKTCYIEDRVVERLPYINENETRLWYDRAEIEFADGHTEPTPTDGTVWYLDSSDRPHGEADGRYVMWTKRSATSDTPSSPVEYTRHDYVALPSVNGWGTDMMVAPDSDEPVSGIATHPTLGTHNFLAFPMHAYLAVDANRDGEIKLASEDDSDATSADKPFRFWINDDDDSGETGGDDRSLADTDTTRNCLDTQVNGIRDLVDFFPVYLDLKQLLSVLPAGTNGISYYLKQEDAALGFVYTNYTRSQAFDYLRGDPASLASGFGPALTQKAGEATVTKITAEGVDLFSPSSAFLTQVQSDGGVLLIEASKATTKPLVLEVRKGTDVIATVELPLKIDPVETMFHFLNIRSLAHGTAVAAAAQGPGYADPTAATAAPNDPFQSVAGRKNLVFVHGYNWNGEEARGGSAEMFKRFYWAGSKANFYAVLWRGDDGQGEGIAPAGATPDYHRNVGHAWQQAPYLRNFVAGLSGQTVIVAHSLGNMITTVALTRETDPENTARLRTVGKPANVTNYFALNAAVPLEALASGERTATTTALMRHPDWNGYDERLWPSHWSQLFPATDGRSQITWLDTFSGLAVGTNFYSSGDQVLMDPDPNSDGIPAWQPLFFGGTRAWVAQEKLKGGAGRPLYPLEAAANQFLRSWNGGWITSTAWYMTRQKPGGGTFQSQRFPEEARDEPTGVPTSALPQEPFYKRFQSSEDGVFYPGYQGSRLIAPLGDSNADDEARKLVTQAKCLAEAIPALSKAQGSNSSTRYTFLGGNLDLNIPYSRTDGTGFKNGWPSSRPAGDQGWKHGDYIQVAYTYTFPLFEKLVSEGSLK